MESRYSPKRKKPTRRSVEWVRRLIRTYGRLPVVAVGVLGIILALCVIVAVVWWVFARPSSPNRIVTRSTNSLPSASSGSEDEVLDELTAQVRTTAEEAGLDRAHTRLVRLLSHASVAKNHVSFLQAAGVDELDTPVVPCGSQYELAKVVQLLGHCLPFARRGALMVFASAKVSREQQRAELETAAALGEAGFLVLLRIPDDESWLGQTAVLRTSSCYKIGPNLFLVKASWELEQFGHGPTQFHDPVGIPMLFLGRPSMAASVDVDFDALAGTGSPVLVLLAPVTRGTRSRHQQTGQQRQQRREFLAAAMCSEGVAAGLVTDDTGVQLLESLAPTCKAPVVLLEQDAAGLTGADAFAAQVAAILAKPFGEDGALLCNRVTAAWGDSPACSPAKSTNEQPEETGDEQRSLASRVLDLQVPATAGPVPQRSQAHCGNAHPYVLSSFLLRCLPGRRAAYMQAETIPWDSKLYQRPQHMSTAMDKLNILVLYMHFSRAKGVIQRAPRRPNVFLADAELKFVSPLRGLIINIYSTMHSLQPGTIGQLTAAGNEVVYEYIDAIDQDISGNNLDRLLGMRREAIDKAVLVTYTARALRQDVTGERGFGIGFGSSRSSRRPDYSIAFVPNGVDPDMYRIAGRPSSSSSSSSASFLPTPNSIQHIVDKGKPIVGYFGAIAPWIWVEAITDIARGMPEAEFLLIGPEYYPAKVPEPASLPPNLHYHEPVAAADLVKFAQHFTVGFIPFRSGNIAKTTSPLKLFEYFAMGLPSVVTRDMDECTQFKHVRAASSVDEYVKQLRAAVKDADDEAIREEILQLAQQNSWDVRAETTVQALTTAMQLRNARP